MRDPEAGVPSLTRVRTAGLPAGTAPSMAAANPRSARPAVRVLMGLVDEAQAGGVFAAERSMIRGLESIGGVEVLSFMFGRRSRVASFANRSLRLFCDLGAFARVLLRERPAVVHLNSAYNRNALCRDVLYLAIARAFRVRVFLKYHGSDAGVLCEGGGMWRELTRVVVGLSSRVGLLSTEELNNFVAAGFTRDRFVVVSNAVDLSRVTDAQEQGQAHGLLFIARFVPPKGLADLLDAMALLRRRGVQIPLVCVGDGPQMSEARERVRNLGLGDAVAFTGQIPEDATAARYRAASILVLPTYHQEGFPMTILHGMAAGMAVVTTRIRAAADHLREPENCLWVLPHNAISIADAIERLVRDPALCLRMRQANVRKAREFRGETVAGEYRELYHSIAEGR